MFDLEITANYLTFFTDESAPKRRMQFFIGDRLHAEYQIRFSKEAEGFHAFLDVRRFRGLGIRVALEPNDPELMYVFRQTDTLELPGLYEEPLRPLYHYSVKSGWHNDPNGLIRIGDTFHMFYQYGPCGIGWNNMHWGHAVSDDLVHWKELPCAMAPGERGMPFSGSAVIDSENISGLGSAEHPPILFYYTATGNGFTIEHGGDSFTQCLAYSIDGCRTIRQFGGNPLLSTLESGNRDPHVSFSPELNAYVMALYFDGNRFGLFRSNDLLRWEQFQMIELEDDEECPNLYPVLTDTGERKWVFSAAHDRYLIGSFSNGQYVQEQPEMQLSYGDLIYASQPFAPHADRMIRISWEQTRIPAGRFSQQMSVPMDLRLVSSNGKHFLAVWPVAELSELAVDEREWTGVEISDGESFEVALNSEVCDVELRFASHFSGRCEIQFFGKRMVLDSTENTATVDGMTSPFSRTGKAPSVRLLLDRCTFEAFFDGGTVLTARQYVPDVNQNRLCITAQNSVRIFEIRCARMTSIWSRRES